MAADVTYLHTPEAPGEATVPRPGSRADRMSQPLSRDALRQIAEYNGVCVRPLVFRRIDTETGEAEVFEVPCGARLAADCGPCAERNRKLRQQQLREGWHLTEEPTITPDPPGHDVIALIERRADLELQRHQAERACDWATVEQVDEHIAQVDDELSGRRVRGVLTPKREGKPRRKRSTRRRTDAAELPRLPVDPRTVGKVYAGKNGRVHVQSTLVTVTLGSYGDVHSANRRGKAGIQTCACGVLHAQTDPLVGTPVDPGSYDYRQAALDAIFLPKVLDRFWQNLRRAAGWNIQYAGAVEMQKRLAPHAHYAMRGTVPRKLVNQTAAATYHQVWWPQFDTPAYTIARPPVWDNDQASYVDPKTREPLPTWAEALDTLDNPDATPAYVARLGRVDTRGIEHGTKHAERSIRYVTKYLTKDLAEQVDATSNPQRAHLDRLHAELSVLPCSPTCANWLLYGVQPDKAKAGLTPGHCRGKVHRRKTLGFTGRRVLISRQWSGKTLADHRADNRAWIRAILAGALAPDEQHDQDHAAELGRYHYELAHPGDPDVPSLQHRILTAVAVRSRWRDTLQHARTLEETPSAVSATQHQQPAFAA